MNDTDLSREITLYVKAAREALAAAQVNLEAGFHRTAAGRMYYAAFYSVTALLKTRGLSFSKHTAVLSAFRRHFIKTGVFRTEYSDLYKRLFDLRHTSDYDILTTVDAGEVEKRFHETTAFVDEVASWLRQHNFLPTS